MMKQEFKERCIELRKQNLTLGEMVKILNRPKTTIYFHIRNIAISRTLKEKISQINRKQAAKSRPKKGKSLLKHHSLNFGKWTPERISLIAHSMFDGEVRHVGINYNNRSEALIDNFKKLMELLYPYEPRIYINQISGVTRLSYHNVELGPIFKSKSSELIAKVTSMPLNFQRVFLKAFFNDEGCIYFKNKKRLVKGYQHDDQILFLVNKLLKNFNIDSVVDTRFHELVISHRENLEKFAQEINFMPGVCVNGQRSNSIWKKSLEKREILNMALNSYQT